MKKALSAVLALILVLAMALTACTPNNPVGPDGPGGESGNKPTETTITVTFNSEGGSAVESLTLKPGEALKLPAAPTRDGYTFVKWVDTKTEAEIKDGMTFDGTETVISARAVWEEDAIPVPEGKELEKEIKEFLGAQGINGLLQTAFIDPTVIKLWTAVVTMSGMNVDGKTLKAWYKEIKQEFSDYTGHTTVSYEALDQLLNYALGVSVADMKEWSFNNLAVFKDNKGFDGENGGVVYMPIVLKSINKTDEGYEVLYHTDKTMGPKWGFCSENLSFHEADNMKATLVWNGKEGHFVIKSNVPEFGAKKGWGITNFLNKEGNNAIANFTFNEENITTIVELDRVVAQFTISWGLSSKKLEEAKTRAAKAMEKTGKPDYWYYITKTELDKRLQQATGHSVDEFTTWGFFDYVGVYYDEKTELYMTYDNGGIGIEPIKPTFVKEYEQDGRMLADFKATGSGRSYKFVIERLFDGSFRFVSAEGGYNGIHGME